MIGWRGSFRPHRSLVNRKNGLPATSFSRTERRSATIFVFHRLSGVRETAALNTVTTTCWFLTTEATRGLAVGMSSIRESRFRTCRRLSHIASILSVRATVPTLTLRKIRRDSWRFACHLKRSMGVSNDAGFKVLWIWNEANIC